MKRLLAGTLSVVALVTAGCEGCNDGNKTTASPTPSASTAAPATASAPPSGSAARRDRPGMRGRGGATASLFSAANAIELEPEQKTKLEDLQKKLEGDDASPRDEMKDVHEALVAGVKAGKIDNAKLEPLYADVEKAAKGRQQKEAEVMNGIYAALEPAQRTAVVKNIRDMQAKREERMAKRGGGDGGSRGDYDAAKWQRARVERMTRELNLDAEQQKKVEAALSAAGKGAPDARADAKKRMDAILAAFEKEGFDANKLGSPDAKHARQPLEDEAKFLGAILPVLKPEQREKLATTMGRGGKGSHGRHGGAHGRPAVGGHDDDDEVD